MGLFKRAWGAYQMRDRGWVLKGSRELLARSLVEMNITAVMSNFFPNIILGFNLQQ